MNSSKRVLVTGGAGYIGSHMVHMLDDAGWEVTVFDDLSMGHADSVTVAQFIKGDLNSPDDLERVFKGRTFDLVMHFAAYVSVAESVLKPLLYYRNNFGGTLNLINAMMTHGVNRLVFSSSCAVYGIPENIPIGENEIMAPVNPYGSAKMAVEKVLEDCARSGEMESISLRYFNAAGCDPKGRVGERHDPETHLIPMVLDEAMRLKRGGDAAKSELWLYAQDYSTPDGSCIRDYIHVEDICRAHMLASERLIPGGDRGYEFFNLANGVGFSVKEVIDTCRSVTGIDLEYNVYDHRREGDPPILIGDSALIGEVMGWSPNYTDLKEIIETAWRWKSEPKAGQDS